MIELPGALFTSICSPHQFHPNFLFFSLLVEFCMKMDVFIIYSFIFQGKIFKHFLMVFLIGVREHLRAWGQGYALALIVFMTHDSRNFCVASCYQLGQRSHSLLVKWVSPSPVKLILSHQIASKVKLCLVHFHPYGPDIFIINKIITPGQKTQLALQHLPIPP